MSCKPTFHLHSIFELKHFYVDVPGGLEGEEFLSKEHFLCHLEEVQFYTEKGSLRV